MRQLYESFLISLKAQISADSLNYAKFMTEETFINGKPFSFEGHDFQRYCTDLVQNNPGCTFAITKPSQIGMSEWVYRIIVTKMAVMPGSSVVLSMPSLQFSQEIFKVRLASVIQESPVLRGLIDRNNDSASVKMFVNGSIAYGLSGSDNSKSSLLNRSVMSIVIDEVDRQSRKVYTGYRSRQTHIAPKDRCTIMISTPTVANFGIDREVSECGVIHEPLVKCDKCGNTFLPDYYEDIVIPDYKESLLLITKSNISGLRVDDAYLRCPECKGRADKRNGHREIIWNITENGNFPKTSIGVRLNPWVAFSFISLPDLIRASVTFTSYTEFLQQALGKTALLSDSALDRSVFTFDSRPKPEGIHVFGLDMGKQCSWMQGVLQHDTTVRITESKLVLLNELEEFLAQKHKDFQFSCGVMDQQPFADMSYRLVRKYPRLYSCIYINPATPIPELYKLKINDRFGELIRQVALNKTLGFDTFFDMLQNQVSFQTSELDGTILMHFLSLRKVRDYTRGDDLNYAWVKTSREDHFAHSYIYLMTAAKLAISGANSAFGAIPLCIGKMNVDQAREKLRKRY